MKFFKRLFIVVINIIIILWLYSTTYNGESTDFFGLFILSVIFFLLLFNGYAWIMLAVFDILKKFWYVDLLFFIVILFPFSLVFY